MGSARTIGSKGQVTIPSSIRKRCGLNEGDPVVFELTDEGILLRPQKIVDASQAWFWKAEWQTGEREASADIAAGRTEVFDNPDDFLVALKDRS